MASTILSHWFKTVNVRYRRNRKGDNDTHDKSQGKSKNGWSEIEDTGVLYRMIETMVEEW